MNASTPNATSTVPRGERIRGVPDPIVIRQLYLGCLSQASYVVGDRSTGRAIAVDPRRDVDEMLDAAAEEGLTIELVVETHFHADFLSGHLELANATGAQIAIGAAGTTEFESRRLTDGELIDLGGVQVEVWSTPGHTPESISLVVHPAPGAEPAAVLTGDTLFIGDVGRPDLLVAADVPAEYLGAQLYDSINRLAGLPDATVVLPAHGAGSACGKALSSETVSTIGDQRISNYALAPMAKERFIEIVTDGQPTAPGYFGYDAALNRRSRPLMDERPLASMDLASVDSATADGAVVVDVRPVFDFAAGHLAGSLGIALDGRFAEQAGTVVDPDTPIILAGDTDAVEEARIRLARIGFDRVFGALTDVESVLATHPTRARRLSRLTARAVAARKAALGEALAMVDVRLPSEVAAAPVAGAINIPLARLRHELARLDPSQPTVLLCAGGERSAIASSVLLAAGFQDVSDVLGGASALSDGGVGSASSPT
jgi:glyoxylase-like metal-dependent hydrolase (beta-lactamase superfamily II)/rhodanese-related sulfurtransferase